MFTTIHFQRKFLNSISMYLLHSTSKRFILFTPRKFPFSNANERFFPILSKRLFTTKNVHEDENKVEESDDFLKDFVFPEKLELFKKFRRLEKEVAAKRLLTANNVYEDENKESDDFLKYFVFPEQLEFFKKFRRLEKEAVAREIIRLKEEHETKLLLRECDIMMGLKKDDAVSFV